MRSLRKIILLLTLLYALLTTSCSNPFNPEIKEGGTRSGLVNNTPANVLRNLMDAYNQKNIELYKNCLAPDFRFYVKREHIHEIGIDWWGYEQEVEYHTRLFSPTSREQSYPSPSSIFLNLEIPYETMWDTSQGDIVIIQCYFHLMLTYISAPEMIATGIASFHLKKVGEEWFIVEWIDNSYI